MQTKLHSFAVRGFRALSSLDLDSLGSINLLVGKNNTGKTTVLEALRIYFSSDPRLRIFNLLNSREEFTRSRRTSGIRSSNTDPGFVMSFDALFTGRQELTVGQEFHLGPMGDEEGQLKVGFVWITRDESAEEYEPARYHVLEDPDSNTEAVPGYIVVRDGRTILGPLDRFTAIMSRRQLRLNLDEDVVYLPSNGMTMREIGEIWDLIALTDEEDEVVRGLRIIAPEIEKLVLIQSPQEATQRMLMAKLSSFTTPVPFKSLGEGTVHFLSLILALIQAKNGVALLDEVENGVHHSVQDVMWKLIMEQASKLNVQVFATTHSQDCVNGFESASKYCPDVSAKVIRLERRVDGIGIVDFSPDELTLARDAGIEIR